MSHANTVSDAWRKATEAEKARPPMIERTYVYASGWRECKRCMCLDLLHPEDIVFEGSTLERFRDGDVYEEAAVAHLQRAGKHSDPPFRVEGQQERFVLKDRKGRPVIVGKIDGKLHFQGRRDRIPFEIKSGVSVQNVSSLEGLKRGKWTKAVLPQVLSYLFGAGVPAGILVLNRPGYPKLLDVHLDDEGLEIAEDFLQRATVAVAVKYGEEELPDFHGDPSVCLRCDHRGKSCAPPIESGDGMVLINDEELEQSAREVVECEEAHKKYQRARKHVSSAMRGKPLVTIGGSYVVSGKWKRYTRDKTPPEIKAKYAEVDEQGSWSMEIEKLPD